MGTMEDSLPLGLKIKSPNGPRSQALYCQDFWSDWELNLVMDVPVVMDYVDYLDSASAL